MKSKQVCILLGSPRKNGNTIQLVRPFADELTKLGYACTMTWLYDKVIRPCLACRACQKDWSIFGCVQKDDMEDIFQDVLQADWLVLATPIYSWYCTPPMKAVMDRLVYGMNKYYGDTRGPALWAGKTVSLITTCGYRPEQGADLWAEGVRRYCKHSQLIYTDMLAERHMGYKSVFMDAEKERHARDFAHKMDAVLKL